MREGVVQGEGEEKDERHIRDSKGGGEAEMEENTSRKLKCEKSVERGLEKKSGETGHMFAQEKLGSVCVFFFFAVKRGTAGGLG